MVDCIFVESKEDFSNLCLMDNICKMITFALFQNFHDFDGPISKCHNSVIVVRTQNKT